MKMRKPLIAAFASLLVLGLIGAVWTTLQPTEGQVPPLTTLSVESDKWRYLTLPDDPEETPMEPPLMATPAFLERADGCGLGSNAACLGDICALVTEIPLDYTTGPGWLWRNRNFVVGQQLKSTLDLPVGFCDTFLEDLGQISADSLYGMGISAKPGWSTYCIVSSSRDFPTIRDQSDALRAGLAICDHLIDMPDESRPFHDLSGKEVSVAVSGRALTANTTLTAEDLTTQMLLVEAIPSGMFLESKFLVGRTPIRSVPVGRPIHSDDLQPVDPTGP